MRKRIVPKEEKPREVVTVKVIEPKREPPLVCELKEEVVEERDGKLVKRLIVQPAKRQPQLSAAGGAADRG
jgi:hypothetical protein